MRDIDHLVGALRQRDQQALAQLYDRYGNAVYALALRVTGDAGAIQAAAVTVERAGGVAKPQGPMVLIGSLGKS